MANLPTKKKGALVLGRLQASPWKPIPGGLWATFNSWSLVRVPGRCVAQGWVGGTNSSDAPRDIVVRTVQLARPSSFCQPGRGSTLPARFLFFLPPCPDATALLLPGKRCLLSTLAHRYVTAKGPLPSASLPGGATQGKRRVTQDDGVVHYGCTTCPGTLLRALDGCARY